jgi:hypothetical protein
MTYNSFVVGTWMAVGYCGLDNSGQVVLNPPDNLDFCFNPAVSQENRPFNTNPLLNNTKNRKYLPAGGDGIKLVTFEFDCPLQDTQGFILFSVRGIAQSSALVANLASPTDVDRVTVDGNIVDPNHIDVFFDDWGYSDLFTTASESGGKKFYLVKLKQDTGARSAFSYHTVMHIRPTGQDGNYNPTQSRWCLYPAIPESWMEFGTSTFKMDIFRMSQLIIFSFNVTEVTKEVETNQGELNQLSTGGLVRADTYQSLIFRLNTLLQVGYPVANCAPRVKGRDTIGYLTNQPVLEKNEVFNWFYYEEGTRGSETFSTWNFEGWNSCSGLLFMESTTMSPTVLRGGENIYRVDWTIDGDDIGTQTVQYPVNVDLLDVGLPSIDDDKSLAYMPTRGTYEALISERGILDFETTRDYFRKTGSFNPTSMADRFYNARRPSGYMVVSSLYPLTNPSITAKERASGLMTNYTTAGGLSISTLDLVYDTGLALSFNIAGAYNTDELKTRTGSTLTPSGDNSGATGIQEGTIFFMYGVAVNSTFTQDPA